MGSRESAAENNHRNNLQIVQPSPAETDARLPVYAVVYQNGNSRLNGSGEPRFAFLVKNELHFRKILNGGIYPAAASFIRGEFDIEGDLVAAIRFRIEQPRNFEDTAASVAARISPARIQSWFQTYRRAAKNVGFHYDRSNEFYRTFLDSRMVYSCAYFRHETEDLDDAQFAKLDHICRKLDIRPGDRLLDIGCGWGALVMHAAENYGATALGCTLSSQQSVLATRMIADRDLGSRAVVRKIDYRKLQGAFQKVASVGMFEHVGRRRLYEYFCKVFSLLDANGLFLNHGIMRPEGARDGADTLFLQRRVFPGGELTYLGTVIREAECAGFEVLDVENLRPHYALTCRKWVERLRRNRYACIETVGVETYRTWLLYLAGAAANFELARTDIHQILLAKRDSSARHLTREYIYRDPFR